MQNKTQSLDDLMADYEKEHIAEIDHWEKNKPQWVKDKIEAERKRDIEQGIRDAEGNFIVPDDADEDEDDEEAEDEE